METEIIEKIREHYEHAKAKHPYFCDMITCLSESGANTHLDIYRATLALELERNSVEAGTLLFCEYYEAIQAYMKGDTASAIEECYNASDLDCIWWVLCKAQNGPTGKLPFLVRKKYFAWMLGDYEAEAKRETVGYGSTAREVVDNSPKFARVHADWRHDDIERELARQFVLLAEGEVDTP